MKNGIDVNQINKFLLEEYKRKAKMYKNQLLECHEDKIKALEAEIDNFVSFLIRENCEGCKECEPRLSTDWKPKFACVEEGRAKWLLSMAEKYKAEREGEK